MAPGPQFAHPWVSVSLWVKLAIYKQCNAAANSHMIATMLAVVQQHRHTSQTDHWVPQARVLWCCHGTLTTCSQEQSEWVSSSSRSVCLIRPHFILLLLLQFRAKPSETYIYILILHRYGMAALRCTTFYKVDAWSLFTPGCTNFSQQDEKNTLFFLNKSCCWFFFERNFSMQALQTKSILPP